MFILQQILSLLVISELSHILYTVAFTTKHESHLVVFDKLGVESLNSLFFPLKDIHEVLMYGQIVMIVTLNGYAHTHKLQ